MDYSQFKDEDITDKLSNAEIIERFEESDGWRLIQEACKRTVLRAQEELLHTPADNTVRMVELQQIIKLYRNVLNGLINSFKNEGRMAFEEAKERGLLKKSVAG